MSDTAYDLELAPRIPETIRVKVGEHVYPLNTIALTDAIAEYVENRDNLEALAICAEHIGIPDLTAIQLWQLVRGLPTLVDMEAVKKNLRALIELTSAPAPSPTDATSSSTVSPAQSSGH